MISLTKKGDFSKTYKYLNGLIGKLKLNRLEKYAIEGVERLQEMTPKDTGLTASSWYYEIKREPGAVTISFLNSNVNNYVNIAIILQYGHATRNGGWVKGVDYINPALEPVFDRIAKAAWEEVTSIE